MCGDCFVAIEYRQDKSINLIIFFFLNSTDSDLISDDTPQWAAGVWIPGIACRGGYFLHCSRLSELVHFYDIAQWYVPDRQPRAPLSAALTLLRRWGAPRGREGTAKRAASRADV